MHRLDGRAIVIGLVAGVLAVGAAMGAYAGIDASSDPSSGRLAGVPASKIGSANGQVAATVPPQTLKRLEDGRHTVEPSPASSICNSPVSSGGTVAQFIAGKYGEVRSCVSTGAAWVITTLGTPGASDRQGVVAVYSCSTTACQSGQGSYTASNFTIVAPLYPGGVTVLGKVPGDPQSLIIDDAGHQMTFDATTLTFSH
jgi:hypothetical protein